MLKALLGRRAVQEKALAARIGPPGDVATRTARREVYAKFFALGHAGQDHVKQSTTRLHFIADKLVQMTMDMYKEPKRLVEEVSTLGLRHVLNSFRLQEERDVSLLRIAKRKTSNTNLSSSKAVTLASLHSLVKDWGSQHKAAWSCLWEDVPRMLKVLLGKPAVHEDTLADLIGSLGEVATQTARCEVYAKFFVLAHAG